MSIIYDALKKVELSQGANTAAKTERRPGNKRRSYLLLILVLVTVFFIVNLSYRQLAPKPPVQAPPVVEAVPPAQPLPPPPAPAVEAVPAPPEAPQPTPSFVLNGIFYADDGSYALINNRVVEPGDNIDGATVLKITADEVDLEFDGAGIKLLNSAR
ncbi:MAG: hypothetical protein WC301_02025 [Candidatus Omnitrophota bacterium]|jgi:hypothetical protein